jgi:hypothetical protein
VSGRRGSGEEQTTPVVTGPRPAIRSAAWTGCRIDRGAALSTEQSSPVVRCASRISGVADPLTALAGRYDCGC